jgi:aromatic-L-amino-acid decarboxylase
MSKPPSTPGPLGDIANDEARARLHEMADWVADYRAGIGGRPIVLPVTPGEIVEQLGAAEWETATPFDRVMAEFDEIVMPGIVNWGHPSFLGYFGSTSNTPALLGEIAAAALNISAMTWKTSPAATEMETVVVGWVREMVGLDPSFTGIVYDTASVSTLHALAAARESAGGDIRASGISAGEAGSFRIYASDQAHSSIVKSAILLGIGERNVVRIPTDENFSMDATLLESAIDSDIASGLKPMAVVATIGTTSTASVDPIRRIADVCTARGIWLHVDAAYGAAMAVMPEGRWVIAGTEAADSIVINPHKWMFVPLDFSVLYTRHPDLLRSVFALTPEYLRGDATTEGTVDYMDYGIQLGRRFRALKAWMTFRMFGRAGIESRIREHCRLAREFADLVEADSSFVLAAPVVMAVVCFRCVRPGLTDAELDALNESVAETVNSTGRAYITHTRLKGRTALRIGIGNIATEERHITQVWDIIRDVAAST